MSLNNVDEETKIFDRLWANEDYTHSKKAAHKAATEYAPLLTKLETAVDIRCCGSLGTRCVGQQNQALLHFSIGNQKMRVNAKSIKGSRGSLKL